ncbi:MAG: DUF192 domain-containing protein [Gammaproteobacteria bacterium]|nr:DUF192 domain-containing protein [Gammaproteobacteria bacterium]MDE2346359.1 DUF192 domain-containing protein [Gammaproteobacteria bacterium]
MRLCLNIWLAALIATTSLYAANPPATHILLAGHRFGVEIASTEAAREHGLMYRTHMAPDHGMLFVFSDAQQRYFWMKNTLIPLDIIFFDAHKRLINVSANTPPCKTPECPTYGSAAPARYVLELNAGMAAKLGLKTGDKFTTL